MRYTAVDSAEWMYPDIQEYATAAEKVSLAALSGGFASFQIMLTDAPASGVTVTAEGDVLDGCEICIYRLKSVRVEGNPGFDGTALTDGTEGFGSPDMIASPTADRIPSQPCRVAPYRVYDCICPLGDAHRSVSSAETAYVPPNPTATGAPDPGGVIALYVTVRYTAPGRRNFVLRADGVSVPVSVNVLDAPVPPETLKIAQGYYPFVIEAYHGVRHGTDEFRRIDKMYRLLMRRSRQNVLYVDHPMSRRIDGRWQFDFRHMEHEVEEALKMGFRYFFIRGIGFRKSWSEEAILIRSMDSESVEGIEYTEAYLAALREFLSRRGWTQLFAMGVADEPNAVNIDRYVSLARRMKRVFPKLKLYDAVSYLPGLRGVLDICIPRADSLEAHGAELRDIVASNGELWHYVCLFPRGNGYINRFTDMPLLATRYLMWGCYSRGLAGFLHWSVNCYMEGQDPFECSCPAHVNAGSRSVLPPGDSHNVYPGEGEPWMSMRLEAQRQGAEEYEMLRTVALYDLSAADGLCRSCFGDFSHVEYDVKKQRRTREALMKAYEAAVHERR